MRWGKRTEWRAGWKDTGVLIREHLCIKGTREYIQTLPRSFLHYGYGKPLQMLFGFITGLHVCLREAVRGALKEKRAYSSPTSTPHHQSGLTLDGLMKPGACFGKNLALLFIMINLYLSFCTTSVQSWGKISKSLLALCMLRHLRHSVSGTMSRQKDGPGEAYLPHHTENSFPTLGSARSKTCKHHACKGKYHEQQRERQMSNLAVLFINLDVNTFSLFKMEYTLQGLLLLNHNMKFFTWLIF